MCLFNSKGNRASVDDSAWFRAYGVKPRRYIGLILLSSMLMHAKNTPILYAQCNILVRMLRFLAKDLYEKYH